jgi:hypothetical protein
MTGPSDTLPLRVDYLDRGWTVSGLHNVLEECAHAGVDDLRSRAYYSSVRQNTLSVASLEPELRRAYRALALRRAVPNVYLAIGIRHRRYDERPRSADRRRDVPRASDSPVSVLSLGANPS